MRHVERTDHPNRVVLYKMCVFFGLIITIVIVIVNVINVVTIYCCHLHSLQMREADDGDYISFNSLRLS